MSAVSGRPELITINIDLTWHRPAAHAVGAGQPLYLSHDTTPYREGKTYATTS